MSHGFAVQYPRKPSNYLHADGENPTKSNTIFAHCRGGRSGWQKMTTAYFATVARTRNTTTDKHPKHPIVPIQTTDELLILARHQLDTWFHPPKSNQRSVLHCSACRPKPASRKPFMSLALSVCLRGQIPDCSPKKFGIRRPSQHKRAQRDRWFAPSSDGPTRAKPAKSPIVGPLRHGYNRVQPRSSRRRAFFAPPNGSRARLDVET